MKKNGKNRLKSDKDMFPIEYIDENVDFILNAEKTPEEIFEDIMLKIEKKESDNRKNLLKKSISDLLESTETINYYSEDDTEETKNILDNIKLSIDKLGGDLDNLFNELNN